MKIAHTIAELKEYQQQIKNKSLGFIPTMGALHQGHLSLVKKAIEDCEEVCVSIFVNPTQFNDPKDFKNYPNTLAADLDLLRAAGVNCVWLPQEKELYPDAYNYHIKENMFSKELCGAFRTGHFEGMLTIVLKLLQLVQAQKVYFGEKDQQQLLLVKGLVKAFFVPTEVVACPTVRDSNGLALSSRNTRLSPQGLALAQNFARQFARTLSLSLEEARHQLSQIPLLEIEYLEDREARRYAAVFVEGVRLIDNHALTNQRKSLEGNIL
jgi:pantoate--beta-alanine ligase